MGSAWIRLWFLLLSRDRRRTGAFLVPLFGRGGWLGQGGRTIRYTLYHNLNLYDGSRGDNERADGGTSLHRTTSRFKRQNGETN